MSASRWFNLLVFSTLAVALVLTVAGALATYHVASAAGPAVCARPVVHLSTIRAEFDAQRGAFVIRRDSVPTGVDGGLLSILGEVRSCSN